MARASDEIARDQAHMQEFGYELVALEKLPRRYHDGLKRYIHRGIPPGGFLSAVLRNDLFAAVGAADDPSVIPAICRFLYNSVAAGSFGSEERFRAWMKMGGFEGWKRHAEADKLIMIELRKLTESERDYAQEEKWRAEIYEKLNNGVSPKDAVHAVMDKVVAGYIAARLAS